MRNSWRLLAMMFVCIGACATPQIDVVQTVPLETNLAVPGVLDSQTVWLEMIRGAQKTIDLEQFYVSDQAGEPLAPVLAAISDAAARGVTVRFLVDSKFFKTYPDSVTQLGNLDNIEAKTIDYSTYGGVQHAKYFVVDGKDSFVGSQNFDWRALNHIHEVGLHVVDEPIAQNLEAIFATDWAQGVDVVAGHTVAPQPVPSTVKTDDTLQVVASPQAANPDGIGYSGDAITSLMESAKSSMKIQVMTYSTNPSTTHAATWTLLDKGIRAAAARGVKVQLMVDVSDLKKAKNDLSALIRIKNIEIKVVTIPAWSGGPIDYARLIHAKYMVIDGTAAWIGSENWTQSYFEATRDVGYLTRSSDVCTKLGLIYDQLWNQSYSSNL